MSLPCAALVSSHGIQLCDAWNCSVYHGTVGGRVRESQTRTLSYDIIYMSAAPTAATNCPPRDF